MILASHWSPHVRFDNVQDSVNTTLFRKESCSSTRIHHHKSHKLETDSASPGHVQNPRAGFFCDKNLFVSSDFSEFHSDTTHHTCRLFSWTMTSIHPVPNRRRRNFRTPSRRTQQNAPSPPPPRTEEAELAAHAMEMRP